MSTWTAWSSTTCIVGELLAALEEMGIADNTIVILLDR